MKCLILSVLLFAPLRGQEIEPAPPEALPPLQAAIERMLSERESLEALEKAIEEARKEGASEQAILEARFIYHVDRREDESLAKLAPAFLNRRDEFKLSESEIFGVKEDWLAVVEYTQSIAALQRNDVASFKKHITEAFWLSPQQGVAFAPHIERLRLEQAMQKVRIDFSRSFSSLTGDTVSLASLIKGKKAMIFHFWSPWSRECEASASDLVATVAELERNGVKVVSIIGESAPAVIADTEAVFTAVSKKPPGIWIHDSDKASLSQQLRIQNVPMMVLVGLDGKILFNGHPAETRLWQKLQTISPAIKRPRIDDGH